MVKSLLQKENEINELIIAIDCFCSNEWADKFNETANQRVFRTFIINEYSGPKIFTDCPFSLRYFVSILYISRRRRVVILQENTNFVLEGNIVTLVPMEDSHKAELIRVLMSPNVWEYTWRTMNTTEELDQVLTDALANKNKGTQLPSPFLTKLQERSLEPLE